MDRYYIPFTQVKKQKALIVDSTHSNGLVLSHWRGAPTPESVRGDTSADIVFNALHQNLAGLACEAVTANHFDIDGFVGIWSLLNPDLALVHEQVLRQMALIGDFRELNLQTPAAATALKLVCWLNAKEKELFYPPFGADEGDESEVIASVPKFIYFLQSFKEVLLHPEKEKAIWQAEYNQVLTNYQVMHDKALTHYTCYPDISLMVIRTPVPIHYYALFSLSAGYDIVLTLYDNNRYELEYKYTTWIDLASRPTLPRLTLMPLVNHLNKAETSGYSWSADQVTDTGPILRLNGQALNKKQRYANPFERPVFRSSLQPEHLEQTIVNYFRKAYAALKPKKYWRWDEIKQLNKKQN